MSPRLLVGTSSYVLPDDLLPNVRLLAPLVDDVELVLFEGESSNLPSPAVIAELQRHAREGDCGFTVHLPLDAGIGEPDPGIRRRAQDMFLRVIDRTLPLEPHAFVLHPELPLHYHPALGERPKPVRGLAGDEFGAWQEALGESFARFAAEVGPHPLAVENLQYPFEWLRPLLDRFDLGVTMDVGHLLMHGGTVAEHLGAFGDRLTVVHLHGLQDGQDHRDVGVYAPAELEAMLSSVAAVPTGRPVRRPAGAGPEPCVVVTLEVFGWETTHASLRTLASLFGAEGDGAPFVRAAEAIRRAAAEYAPLP